MAHKKGFLASLAQMQHEAEKRRLEQLRAQSQVTKAAYSAQVAYQQAQQQAQAMQMRALAAEEKERKRLYEEAQSARVEWQNAELQQKLAQLQSLLSDTLNVDDYYDLNKLKEQPVIPQFQPGQLGIPLQPPVWQRYQPTEPTAMQKLVPGAKQKYEQELGFAQQRFQSDIQAYNYAESQRKLQLENLFAQYQRYVTDLNQKAQTKNAEIDQFQADLRAGLPEAVIDYFTLVLEASVYPPEFPKKAKIAYLSDSKQLIVEYQLPEFEVVPTIDCYKYVKSRNAIVETPRKDAERRASYSSVVAQITLRTIHELYEADRLNHLEIITFNGMVASLDLSKGKKARFV